MRRYWLAIAVFVVGAGASGYLWLENRRLNKELAAARRGGDDGPAAADGSGAATGRGTEGRKGRDPLAMLNALGTAVAGAAEAKPASAEAKPDEDKDRESRRERRERRMRDLLGRQEGETDEEYRTRVAPLIEMALGGPRDRTDERRRQFEEAAGINEDQRAKLDQAFAEAQGELVGLANAAIASGDLTPYHRNTRGVLAFVGSTVGTVDGVEHRLQEILTPEQWATMDESGFDWVEYLGLHTPWESLTPPPPPPHKSGL